ncbi:MAG: hypothetical protein WCJ93_01720 [Methanomicrobiales archaeon]
MKQLISDSYTRAGTMNMSGEAIVLEIGGGTLYLIKSDCILLSSGQSAGVINEAGDEEGCAWLSPVREAKKKDLVFNLHGRIYVVSWREVQRIMNGQVHLAKVLEYSMKERPGITPPATVLPK